MALQLVEFTVDGRDRASADKIIDSAAGALRAGGAELIEAQVPVGHGQVFLIAHEENPGAVADALAASDLEHDDLAEVRLVGADLDTVRGQAAETGYLVEWDLPEGLSMDSYLARKAEKAPLYAQVPESRFLRTYVREDMGKCLCFYDAPDAAAVERAREAVDTPVDRLHELDRRT
ncbi:DUF4242 domain-containing protein [Nocardiopsis sp. HNM0947]|uniref:DUF4242 domain-containing protein n=1 Tax=Nocardiopsis coralli TaxID=2772213 RepID=A0ABR9P512_9ACTN|nr:DUF4242 domain-containing protein [Nocardiopsis coralli]MBE2998934.1 DUF4242 domain-containing protein [Nocardiopsis coralli]